MTHDAKIEYLIADLQKRGMKRHHIVPPLFRVLWAVGINVPPPLFLGFLPLTLYTGALFGVFWGAIMWVIQWRAAALPLEVAFAGSVLAGLLFGLLTAALIRWKASRLRLPAWESYPEPTEQDDLAD